ncbi:MAG TPA: dihydrodipicolinate synthase family protein, partial [Dongiaceae bacterium]|nr:dihydrodipicolinate synthase family protein [Dongiaceae bacterium]
WRRGDLKAAMGINERLTPLHEALFCESSPGPVKYAASLLGHCQADLRLPLCEIADASKQKVQQALASAGLVN